MNRFVLVCAGPLIGLSPLVPAHASVIYNTIIQGRQANGVLLVTDPDETNSSVELPGTPQEREFDSRVGDVLTFAGTDRFVTEFRLQLWAFAFNQTPGTITADVELTIYQNIGNLPGSPLWTGTRTGVEVQRTRFATDVDFFPNLTLPNSVCFGVAFANISLVPPETFFGLVGDSNTPSVGSSPFTVIGQETATGVWTTRDYGSLFRNAMVRVTAIPAPASALALGVLGLTACRRRRR